MGVLLIVAQLLLLVVTVVVMRVMGKVTVMLMETLVFGEMLMLMVMEVGVGRVMVRLVIIPIRQQWTSSPYHILPHPGLQTVASHLHGQCLFGFPVAIYPGHLFEFLQCLVGFAHNHQPAGRFWQPPVKEAGAWPGLPGQVGWGERGGQQPLSLCMANARLEGRSP